MSVHLLAAGASLFLVRECEELQCAATRTVEGVLVSTEGVTPMVVGLENVNNGAGDRWFGIRDRSVTEWSPVCFAV